MRTHAHVPNFGLSQLWMVAGCPFCVNSSCSVQCGGMLPISVRQWVVPYPGVLVQCAVLSCCHLRSIWCWDPSWLFLQVIQLLPPAKYVA